MTDLEKLLSQLQTSAYTPMTEEELLAEAQSHVQRQYEAAALQARKTWEAEALSLAQQLAALGQSYEKQQRETAAAWRLSSQQAQADVLRRGMQRSSYATDTLTGLQEAAAQAATELGQQQLQQENAIGEQRGLLSRQLTQQLAQYESGKAADTEAYLSELRQREYTREENARAEANNLALKLYEYRHQLAQEEEEASRWKAEYNARYGGSASSASGGSGSSGSSSRKKTTRTGGSART